MRWILPLLLTGCALLGAQQPKPEGGDTPPTTNPPAPTVTTKKLIEFGWDRPRPAALSAGQLENSVFDGVMFSSSAGDRVIVPGALPAKSFDDDIAALQKIGSDKLNNSFYIINVNTDTWDWFDDAAWDSAEQNLYQFARVAKAGGLRGVMFDPEVYAFDLWAYASQPQRAKHSFAAFETQMRKRGAQAIRAFERAYPGISLLSLYLFSALDAAPGATYEEAHAGLAEDGSLGLYGAFAEGMLEAMTDKAVLIDGFESSYYHLHPAQFDAGRKAALEDAQVFVAPVLRAKYERQVKFANAVYVDGVMNLWDSARFLGYYLPDDAARRAVIAHNAYHGLRTSDEFVWVYAEGVNWWKRTVNTEPGLPKTDFAALEAALKRGKLEALAGKPLSDDPAQVVAQAENAYRSRVDVGGDIVGRAGLNISFGALSSHCAVWANAQRWSCTQPKGTTFTVTPTADGVTFTPANRTFTNLASSQWELSFTVKP